MSETTGRLYTANEARALREAATPGPWSLHHGHEAVEAYHHGRWVEVASVSELWDAELCAAAPDLAHTVEALHADLHRLRLTLACEQGRSHDEAGQPHPWTRAGWEFVVHVRGWCAGFESGAAFVFRGDKMSTAYSVAVIPKALHASLGDPSTLLDNIVAKTATALDGIIQAHAALNLPPLEGL